MQTGLESVQVWIREMAGEAKPKSVYKCKTKNDRTGVEDGEEVNICDNQTLPPVK